LNGRTEGRRGSCYFKNAYYINVDGNLKINEIKTRKRSAAFDNTASCGKDIKTPDNTAFCGKDIKRPDMKYAFTI